MLKTIAIKKFLKTVPCPIAELYTHEMEVQVNVAKDNGIPWQKATRFGVSRGWTDEVTGEVWRPFRIPHKADSQPEYEDREVGYDFNAHVDSIGLTGWNWVKRQSEWVVFDFDSIVNHDAGISQQEMDEIENACLGIPYLGVLRSTSGKGLHIYVFFDEGFPTQNHLEHSALARSFLGVLSATLGMKLEASVDCVGSVMWVWARRSDGTNGLTWIKEPTEKFSVKKIPQNWKEHLSVIARKRTKTAPVGKGVNEVATAMMSCELEADHKRILRWFADKAERVWWWDVDNQMLVSHTKDLEQCHIDLNLRGLYKTISSGDNPEQNCFSFPIEGGRFVVRRFGQGANEHSCWQPDQKGWTRIMFNETPTFLSAMLYHGGLLNKKMEVIFETLDQASTALKFLNIDPIYSPTLSNRQTEVKFVKKDALIAIDVVREKNDTKELGWIQNSTRWEKTVPYNEESSQDSLDINLDERVRHTIMSGSDAGWFIKINEEWVEHGRPDVSLVLKSIRPDLKADQINSVMGQQILNPWKRENVPFKEEYPGNRIWNKDASALAYQPKRGIHPTWDMIFEHLGSDLNKSIVTNQWCKEAGILTGADYLFLWCCYMFQQPHQRNPYLFFYGSQNTGKSSLHEALGMLFKGGKGYMDVKNSFSSTGNFNAEMAGCVLGFMDEIDLSRNKLAYSRLKDWTTALQLSIQGKGENPYMTPNTIHLIHTANFLNYCPVEKGDTRITIVSVPPLKNETPKAQFQKMLHDEAPAIVYDFLSTELPPHFGRFGLPAIDTEIKESLMNINSTPMERYILEECEIIEGECIQLAYFKNCFRSWVSVVYNQKIAAEWSDARIEQEINQLWKPIVKGCSTRHNNKVVIGNLILKDDYYKKDGSLSIDLLGGRWIKDDLGKLRYLSDKEVKTEFY